MGAKSSPAVWLYMQYWQGAYMARNDKFYLLYQVGIRFLIC
jgi:hypothetical protein